MHRILKPRLKSNYHTENGWCNSDYVEFDMGNNYISSYKKLLKNDEGE